MVNRVGIIGFGEVGSVLAAGIVAQGSFDVTIFDPFLHTDEAASRRQAAEALGLQVAECLEGLSACDTVLSVVIPAVAGRVGRAFLTTAVPGQMLIDLNSTDPTVKRELFDDARGPQVDYVDGALVGGGIGLEGFGIPVLLAGPSADTAAGRLRSFGMRAEVIGADVGQAAAAKMLRGIVMKGLEGLFVEAFVAAHRHGVVDIVTRTIAQTLDEFEARDLIGMLLSSHIRHCGRRSVEVGMIRDVVAGTGIEPHMSSGASALFERSARSDLDPDAVDASDRISSSAAILSLAIAEQNSG